MSLQVVISCFAGGVPPEAQLPGLRLLDWPGRGPGHPTWGGPAQALRQPNGRLLPALLKSRQISPSSVSAVAVIGFSAGFGGVRELLRDPEDRAAIDFACVLDSLHFPIVGGQAKNWRADDPATIIDFGRTVGPFLAFATEAAQAKKGWVSTWGDIPRPNPAVTSAKEGNLSLFAALLQSAPVELPEFPETFPTRRTSPKVHPGEPYPVPSGIFGQGEAVGLYYPLGADRSLAALKRSHVLQGTVVRADVWRDFLLPRWGGAWIPTAPDKPA